MYSEINAMSANPVEIVTSDTVSEEIKQEKKPCKKRSRKTNFKEYKNLTNDEIKKYFKENNIKFTLSRMDRDTLLANYIWAQKKQAKQAEKEVKMKKEIEKDKRYQEGEEIKEDSE